MQRTDGKGYEATHEYAASPVMTGRFIRVNDVRIVIGAVRATAGGDKHLHSFLGLSTVRFGRCGRLPNHREGIRSRRLCPLIQLQWIAPLYEIGLTCDSLPVRIPEARILDVPESSHFPFFSG